MRYLIAPSEETHGLACHGKQTDTLFWQLVTEPEAGVLAALESNKEALKGALNVNSSPEK